MNAGLMLEQAIAMSRLYVLRWKPMTDRNSFIWESIDGKRWIDLRDNDWPEQLEKLERDR